jgi:plastocyanin
MGRKRLALNLGMSITVLVGMQTSVMAKGLQPAPSTLVIGVDHVDAANQQLDNHRWFEYTDFFSRDVTVHRDEVLDFRLAAGNFGHAIALAGNQAVARRVYPIVTLDSGDSPAIDTGKPKVEADTPGGFSILGGSTSGGGTIGTDPSGQTPPPCGTAATPLAAICTFTGANDIESAGPIFGVDQSGNAVTKDWQIRVDAPAGEYDFLCFFHPAMQGHFKVVDNDDRVTTEAQNDERGQDQFQIDEALGRAAEQEANVVRFSGGQPGTRTYNVSVGVGAADDHLNVLEMLPQKLALVDGDKVAYHWRSPNELHSVGFPSGSSLPAPFGFDCGSTFQSPGPPPCIDLADNRPELIADPGTVESGSPLQSPTALFDAGVLIGRDYHVNPTVREWSLSTNNSTLASTYAYQCTVHDVMHGELTVSSR